MPNTQQIRCCSVESLINAAKVVEKQGRWDLLVENHKKLVQEILDVQQALFVHGVPVASNFNIVRLMQELRQAVAGLPV